MTPILPPVQDEAKPIENPWNPNSDGSILLAFLLSIGLGLGGLHLEHPVDNSDLDHSRTTGFKVSKEEV